MVKGKKNSQPKKKVNLEPLKSIGKFIAVTFEKAAGHPTALALAMMGGAALISTANALADPDQSNMRSREIQRQMAGLYNGAQALGTAAALAPIAGAVIGTVSAFATKGKE